MLEISISRDFNSFFLGQIFKTCKNKEEVKEIRGSKGKLEG